MSENAQEPTLERKPLGWASYLVMGLAGLFYAYAIWNAIFHLIQMAHLGLNPTGWFTLVFAVVFPALVYLGALAVGRRRGVLGVSVALLAGLGLVAVFWLDVIGYSVLNPAALLTA
ncbi:hypothetical protein GCM10025768_12750 [Microbacterium pseudoresistens]|uniref:Uncharacterized protein n=1 Tax=Microbacterium pseudoresistens TaxID=640634 RepID=A0A7Y9JP31_9MICO|nr:hypothetical protein [Microbacterium pseudoresistens]NYD55178.1 hypothetical protein [Microbacterium pseudoresistens]